MKKYFEAITSDKDILKAELIREWVYKEAESLLVAKVAVPETPMGTLDMKFIAPRQTAEDFPVQQGAEGTRADYIRPSFYEWYQTMEKWQQAVMVTDESRARMMADISLRMSMEFAADSFAYKKDDQIFDTLIAGAAGTDAASGLWTDATTEIARDLALTIGNIITNTKITDADLRNVVVFYPAKLWGYLKAPIQVGDVIQTVQSFVTREYRLNLQPTRQLTTTALCVIGGPRVCRHVVYTGGDVPTAEHQRLFGVGDEYLITQYFKTFIMPETEGGTTNNRIRIISGVAA